MKINCIMAIVLFTCTVTLLQSVSADTPEKIDVRELVRRVETQYMGKTSRALLKMKVITESWSREMTMETWSEGRDKFIAKILTPKKDHGVATLKIENDMWNYLPKIDRLMKIPSSLMGDRWMGSHLTNDDMVKGDKIDELYDFELEKIEDNIATVHCTPKPDAAVVWGSITYIVDLEKMIPVAVDYFDEDGELVRTIEFDKVENVSGRWVPLIMRVKPVESPDELTEMVYENLEFDIKLEDDLFSISSLRRR